MLRTTLLVLATAVIGSVLAPTAAYATIPSKYANCTNLNKSYPHGVGRSTARDHVAAGAKPVTTWKHDTNAYNSAMHYNRGLDRDKDYIACEKR